MIIGGVTVYVSIAERGECFPEMLPRIGLVPSRRGGRKRWSGPPKQNKPTCYESLAKQARLRPPFAAISPARDDPYRWEHLREAFSTLRYRNIYMLGSRLREIAGDRARLREIVGDCGVYNMVFFESGAWRTLHGDAPTYRARPEQAKWSQTVV